MMEYNEIINNLESKRKAITKKLLISLGVFIGTLLLGFIISLISHKEQIIIFGGLIGVIVAIGIIADSINKYKKEFKTNLMPLIISRTGLNLKYDYKDGVGINTAMNSKLFKKPDRYHSEDLLYGTIDDVQFMCSDVHMEEKRVVRDSKGRTHVEYITFFRGRWFVYEFNKEFNGIIQVREDGFLQGHPWGLKVEKIQLEDVEFNKKFKTLATNQHDAFYVLTPTLMENIKKLEKRFPGKIYLSFIGNQVHIAIYDSKDSFEPPIFSPINDAFIDNIVADILITQEIINELKLNRKIFK